MKRIFPIFGSKMEPMERIKDLQQLSELFTKGLLERHLTYMFLVIPDNQEDIDGLNEFKNEIFVKTLSHKGMYYFAGNLSDWKRSIEFYLLNHKDHPANKRILACQIMFLLENKFKLYKFFNDYKKYTLPDHSFYLKRI